MKSNIVQLLQPQKKEAPVFRSGDTLRVTTKIHEGDVEKTQHFEGIVTRRHGRDLDETFTVRKLSFGIGIERTFHLNSPNIAKIEVVSKGAAARAKLYHLRKKTSM